MMIRQIKGFKDFKVVGICHAENGHAEICPAGC